MKAMLKKAYLSLVKNQLIILLSLLVVLIIKQLVLYIVLYKQATIDSVVEINLTISIVAILVVILLIIRQYRRMLAREKKQYVDLYLESEQNSVTIDRLTKKLEYYEQNKGTTGDSLEVVVERIKQHIYKGIKKGQILQLPTLFNRICLSFEIGVGILYEEKDGREIVQIADFDLPTGDKKSYLIGEGIIGEVAKSGKGILLCNLPDKYFSSYSGLGSVTPKFLQVFKVDNYILEVACYKVLPDIELQAIKVIIEDSLEKTK